jgi:branched-chain amino acid transport system substrate-binding protein
MSTGENLMKFGTCLGLAAMVATALLTPWPARCAPDPLRIAIMTDLDGMGSDLGGKGSVVAAQLAVDDAGGTVLGRPIVILSGDHQNKSDIGSALATRWYDQDHVDAIVDIPNSSVALAVQEVARQRHKIVLFSGAGSSALTGAFCSPYGFQWTFDTVALARSTAMETLKDSGDTWFFITADFAFGHALAHDAQAIIKANGGRVLGEVSHPYGTTDFSSYLVAAQASGAKIIALANSSTDTVTAVKQAGEFGVGKSGQKLVGLLVSIADVHAIGLADAAGLLLTESFYWDQNDATRAFAARFEAQMPGRKPTMVQAGVYGAVAHYLKAIATAGTDDGDTVAAVMRKTPINDFMDHDVRIRADGRVMRDYYLFQVKTPAESKGPWDYYKLIRTIPAAEAARPESEGGCKLADH